jgi:hypothetical protein
MAQFYVWHGYYKTSLIKNLMQSASGIDEKLASESTELISLLAKHGSIGAKGSMVPPNPVESRRLSTRGEVQAVESFPPIEKSGVEQYSCFFSPLFKDVNDAGTFIKDLNNPLVKILVGECAVHALLQVTVVD